MKQLLLDGLTNMGLSPSEEQLRQLEEYARLLLEQNQVMNLTAITEPEQVARLHFLDCAAILKWTGGASGTARPTALDVEQRTAGESTIAQSENEAGGQAAQGIFPQPETLGTEGSHPLRGTAASTWLFDRSVIDVGTGAGFPGVVLKILEPSLKLTLADSLGKRVSWLKTICEALSLDGVQCLHVRAEELALQEGFRDSFDLAVSRAVASYPLLCELCLPYVKPGGVFLAMKSVESEEEVAAGASAVKRLGGKALGHLDYPIPGTEITHRLVGVKKTSPTPKGLPRSWGKIKKAPL